MATSNFLFSGDSKLYKADIFFGFIDELQSVLGRKVDLVVDSNVTNSYFRKELDATKKLVYGFSVA